MKWTQKISPECQEFRSTYFHVTFPLPQELREVARSHQTIVLAAMMRAAAEALQTLAQDRLGGRLGIMTVLHTWGRTLIWHPHVHCLIPGIVICPDGEFKTVPNRYLVPVKALSKVYRAVFLRLVRSHNDAPKLPAIQWSKHPLSPVCQVRQTSNARFFLIF